MSDIFKEVDEEVEREKLASFWKRYQTPIFVVAVLIVVATGAWSYYDGERRKAAETANARFEAAAALARDGKSAEAITAFNALAKDAPKGYAALARLRAANERAKSKDPADKAKAIEELVAIADDKTVDKTTQEVAQLRAAIFALEGDDRQKIELRLGPLMTSTGPFRYSAQEWNALDALENGDYDEADRVFEILLKDSDAPQSMRQRASAYRGLLHAVRGPTKKSEGAGGAGVTFTPVIEGEDGGDAGGAAVSTEKK